MTPADRDSGLVESISEVDGKLAKDWAIENVEATRKHLGGLWKAAP